MIFHRRNPDCDNHDWATTVHSGLRRDLCTNCGKIRMASVEVVTTKLPIFAESHAGQTLAPFGIEVSDG
ncbi:MAG: hypothetical protein WD990_01055 [Acidimicrobiia bacterium]